MVCITVAGCQTCIIKSEVIPKNEPRNIYIYIHMYIFIVHVVQVDLRCVGIYDIRSLPHFKSSAFFTNCVEPFHINTGQCDCSRVHYTHCTGVDDALRRSCTYWCGTHRRCTCTLMLSPQQPQQVHQEKRFLSQCALQRS